MMPTSPCRLADGRVELGSVEGVGADALRGVDAFELEGDVAVQALHGHDREPE